MLSHQVPTIPLGGCISDQLILRAAWEASVELRFILCRLANLAGDGGGEAESVEAVEACCVCVSDSNVLFYGVLIKGGVRAGNLHDELLGRRRSC